MQFSALRTYAASRFRDPTNAIVLDTDWKNYVNTAYGNVLIEMPFWPFLEATSNITINTGVRSGALPTDVWRVTAVYDQTDQFPMVPLEGRSQVYNEYPQQTETGQPMHYRIFGQNLQVYPLPAQNTTFVVEYAVQPAALVADADLPVFPSQYHDILVVGAVACAYRDDGNLQMAAAYDQEYKEMLEAMKRDLSQPRQDRFYEIVDNSFY